MISLDAVFVGLIVWYAGFTALFAFMPRPRRRPRITYRITRVT